MKATSEQLSQAKKAINDLLRAFNEKKPDFIIPQEISIRELWWCIIDACKISGMSTTDLYKSGLNDDNIEALFRAALKYHGISVKKNSRKRGE